MIAELAFAFMAGTMATANPCGFALLPAYLARRLGIDGDEGPDTTGALIRAFGSGAVMTTGFLLVFGVVGGAVSLGAYWLSGALPWAGLVIGIALAGTGLAVLAGRHVGLRLPAARLSATRSGFRGDLVFGLAYGTVSLSCTLPIFLAVTGTAITGGLIASASSFVAYALGMGTILTALAVAAALARSGLAAAVGRILPYVDRAGGALLFLAGVYVAYFWGDSMFSPDMPGEGNVIVLGERLSATLRGWFSGTMEQPIIFGLLALLVGLFVSTLWRRISSKARYRERNTKPEWLEDRI